MPTKTKAPVMEAPVIEEEQLEPAYPGGGYEGEDASVDAPEADEEEGTVAILTGQDLLEFYEAKAAEGMSHKDIAYQAGYFSVTAKNTERVNVTGFNEALLEAKGVPVARKRSIMGRGRGSAGLTRARVSGAGVLLVSQLAVREVGAEAGSIFQVSFPGEGQILLTATGEIVPVASRKASLEEPGTPLLDQAGE